MSIEFSTWNSEKKALCKLVFIFDFKVNVINMPSYDFVYLD